MTDGRILWPFPVNWDDPFRITYSFKTDVTVSRSGREQRRAIRQTPRKTIEFSSLLGSAVELRAFNWQMTKVQNLIYLLPEYTRKAALAQAVSGSATSVVLADDPPLWIRVGAEVMIADGGTPKLLLVNGVSGRTVSFTVTPGARSINATLHPALSGSLGAEISAPRVTNAVASAAVVLNVLPGSEQYFPLAAATQFGGLDVFDFEPNWSSPVDVRHQWPAQMVDFGFGRTAFHRPVDFPSSLTSATYLGRSFDQIEALVDSFLRAKGRRNTILMSTGEDDLSLVSPIVAGTTTFRVAGTTIFALYKDDPLFHALALRRVDAPTVYRSITGMASDGQNTTVTIDIPWDENIPLASVLSCSWMLSARFASDDLKVEWITDEVGQMQMALQTLPVPVPHEDPTQFLVWAGDQLVWDGDPLIAPIA